MANDRLVYSTNAQDNTRCPRCGELTAACRCKPPEATTGATAVLRIEKAGRGGKTVTVIDRLPRNEPYVKELAGKLKSACGSGGTHRIAEHGVIEIQGDKREQVRALLARLGLRVKG